ncbi:Uncharacterized protein DAT39_022516 [Clarias magur]|uniref:Uncharacterized protein n=1 Tax=Clarias magur TaxID=1594786 RepID=A0A8J4U135_CLAMG|nr:Uncharacterized protein DAT39_022516 [Clarias magur]
MTLSSQCVETENQVLHYSPPPPGAMSSISTELAGFCARVLWTPLSADRAVISTLIAR